MPGLPQLLAKIFGRVRQWAVPQPPFLTNQNRNYSSYVIGDWTYGRPEILDWHDGTRLRIGKFCSIARGVKFVVGGEHRLDWVTTYPFNELWSGPRGGRTCNSKGDLVIHNDVWIGTGATILSGVTVGDGAVIGASSLVTRDVPPYAIVAGNPARIIRYRFSPEMISQLTQIAWWDWPTDKIQQARPLLLSSDLQQFVQQYGMPVLERRPAESSDVDLRPRKLGNRL